MIRVFDSIITIHYRLYLSSTWYRTECSSHSSTHNLQSTKEPSLAFFKFIYLFNGLTFILFTLTIPSLKLCMDFKKNSFILNIYIFFNQFKSAAYFQSCCTIIAPLIEIYRGVWNLNWCTSAEKVLVSFLVCNYYDYMKCMHGCTL